MSYPASVWQPHAHLSRTLSAAVATLLTILLLKLLGGHPPERSLPPRDAVVVMMVLRENAPAVPIVVGLPSTVIPAHGRSGGRVAPRAIALSTLPLAVSPASDVGQPSNAPIALTHSEAPARSASAPLRLDSTTLRAAAKQSKGAVRRMADASGTKVFDTQPTSNEQLAAGVSSAIKPGCLESNGGGSLLDLIWIGVAGINDKCR